VCEYIGELVTRERAQQREAHFAAAGIFYLHDVHGQYAASEGGASGEYTIDPTFYGNVGRMLNHCCEPNLTTVMHFHPLLAFLSFLRFQRTRP
jgi:SET domain-containing protein